MAHKVASVYPDTRCTVDRAELGRRAIANHRKAVLVVVVLKPKIKNVEAYVRRACVLMSCLTRFCSFVAYPTLNSCTCNMIGVLLPFLCMSARTNRPLLSHPHTQ